MYPRYYTSQFFNFRYFLFAYIQYYGQADELYSIEMNSLELVPGKYIGEGNPTFVIAEIGQNHNGKCSTNLRPFTLNFTFS